MKTCNTCKYLLGPNSHGLHICNLLSGIEDNGHRTAVTATHFVIGEATEFGCLLHEPVLLPKESFQENCFSGYYATHPIEFDGDALKYISGQGIPEEVSRKIIQSLPVNDGWNWSYSDLWDTIERMVQIWKD